MKNPIASLRQKKAKALDEMKKLNDAATTAERDLTADETIAYDRLLEEVKSCDGQIKRLEEADRLSASSAIEVAASGAEDAGKTRKKGDAVARLARSLAFGKGDLRRAADFAEQTLHDSDVAKALQANNASGGGFAIPENFAREFIELYYPQTVVRGGGARTVPLVNGNLTLPKITGGASAAYIGEGQEITASAQSLGQVSLRARKLAALVPISNDLIRYASPSADSMVRDDLMMAIANTEDSTFLRSAGSGAVPRGLRYWAPTANLLKVNATVNLVNVTADLSKLMLCLINANIPTNSAKWMTSPRVKLFLADIRDGNGNKAFPEVDRGELRGYPLLTTTNVPINLAVTDTSESELYFVNMSDVVIGDGTSIMLDVSQEASYRDAASGNLVSSFILDQTVIRVIVENDLIVRHGGSVAVLQDVDWGA